MGISSQKKQLDMLHGSIWNKLPVFALPVAATAILEQLFNASDIAVVGNFAAADRTVAIAAVGANSSIIGLIVNLFVGIALGANVVIANAIGRGDRETIQKAVHTAVTVSVLGGLVVALVGELIAAPLLKTLSVPEDVFASALLYLRIYLLGMPVILLYNFEAAIFRSVGETRTPLAALAISGVLNVILNLFFVAVLHMTVNGVAIATVISNVLSSLILFFRLRKTTLDIRIESKKLRVDGSVLKQILQIGLPAGVQSAVFALSNIVIQSAINSLGTIVMAASSAAFNIEIISYYIMNAFSQGCTTFVGQNYGAGKLGRCRRTLILSILEAGMVLAVTISLTLLFGRSMLAVFNRNPDVIEVGYVRLLTILSAYAFSMLYELMSGYLRGFGISLVPAILTTIGVCGIRVGWIRAVFPHHRTFQMIMLVYPISLAVTALLILLALICYRPYRRFSHMETNAR